MVFTFRVLSNEEEDFIREIEILSDQSFLAFHNTIVEACGFDHAQMSSFFISDENWDKGTEITLFDMGNETESDKATMENSIVSNYLNAKGQRLLYVFDFFSERAFFIELVNTLNAKSANIDYPACTYSEGTAPQQIQIDDLLNDLPDIPEDDDFSEEWNHDINLDDLEDISDDIQNY